jgi:3-methyladenine DNA glycosylase AlkD
MTGATSAIAALRRRGSAKNVAGMARYGITSGGEVLGVSVADIRALAKTLGRDHALADALWKTGIYEARMLACFVAEPARVTPAQMDRWCKGFDNWAVCDTACFHLFDKTPHALKKIAEWSKRKPEFERRAAFALYASVALHRKDIDDSALKKLLPLIARAADDERNFVKKAVSWALRGVGGRRPKLLPACLALARQLAASDDRTERWIGKDALRDLSRRRPGARS